jgi:LysM repeat protein
MGAKFVAAVVGVIILVVLAQTFVFGGDDDSPSASNPGSIPTATPQANQDAPVLLGQGDAGGGSSGGGTTGGSPSTYVVQSGDLLGAIAEQLGIPAEEQAAWIQEVLDLNGMEDPRQLQAGQELILPARSGASIAPTDDSEDDPDAEGESTPETQPTAPPSATGTLPTPTPAEGGSAGTYTVVEGDYPGLIAANHCVDDVDSWVAELLEINDTTAESLSIGQELDLPPGTPAFCGGDTSDDEEADDSA